MSIDIPKTAHLAAGRAHIRRAAIQEDEQPFFRAVWSARPLFRRAISMGPRTINGVGPRLPYLPGQPGLQQSPTPTRKVSKENPGISHLPGIQELPTNQPAVSRVG